MKSDKVEEADAAVSLHWLAPQLGGLVLGEGGRPLEC